MIKVLRIGVAFRLEFFRDLPGRNVQEQPIAARRSFDAVALEEEHKGEQGHKQETAHEAVAHQFLLLQLHRALPFLHLPS
ncbi:MAG: hypothetical protein IPG10_05005 [Flavobacteriales bacterium]|nr:hypothetical protein [Flavobacteriales bacterium]